MSGSVVIPACGRTSLVAAVVISPLEVLELGSQGFRFFGDSTRKTQIWLELSHRLRGVGLGRKSTVDGFVADIILKLAQMDVRDFQEVSYLFVRLRQPC